MRVWFNHWFTTVYHIFNLIRQDEAREYEIYASNDKENLVIKAGADVWFMEPVIKDEKEYVNYCLDICKSKDIEVFIPRRFREAISSRRKEFEAIGVKLLVNTDSSVNYMLEQKVKVYEDLKKVSGLKELVPYYVTVKNSVDFAVGCVLTRYYAEKNGIDKICMKNECDEGGQSFRVLVTETKNGDMSSRNVELESAVEKRLEKVGSCNNIMIMPYLKDEVSCDCLSTDGGIIVIPRHKKANRVSTVKFDSELHKYCECLMNHFHIDGICNIQFRKMGDKWKLLEINSRMSGGVQLSCIGSKINLPMIAIKQLLGDKVEFEYSKEFMSEEGSTIVNLETPFKVKRGIDR